MKSSIKIIQPYTQQLVIILVFMGVIVQGGRCQNNTVTKYVDDGLRNNLNIQQQKHTLGQSLAQLATAKGMFYPTLSFKSDYTYASGGRTFVLPLGDILNPAYNALNQLTGTNDFSSVTNQEFNLSANDYYDNRLSLSLYLVNAELFYNWSIRKEVITQRQAEIVVYKRTLVRDIKVAYYNIINTQRQVEIYKTVNLMLLENYMITSSHIRNGKSLAGDSLRILSDINSNVAKITDAQARVLTANAYLNFLVNAPLNTPVAIDTAGLSMEAFTSLSDSLANGHEREEIAVLKSAAVQSRFTMKMRRSAYVPMINTYLNAGYQSTYFKVNNNTNYLLGGLSMKWDLFSGFQNRNKVKFAKSEVLIADTKMEQAVKQFEYLQMSAENELTSANAQLEASRKNLVYLQEYYRRTKSRYDQGMGLLVELNDAFAQLVNGHLNDEQSLNNVLVKKADLERAKASYPLNNNYRND